MPLTSPLAALQAQRGYLFAWVPVLLGLGIGGYFALRAEPSGVTYAVVALVLVALVLLARRLGERLGLPLTAMALVMAGLLLAGARAHYVAAPVLGFRYYGPVEGRIVIIDRSHSDKVRLTLDQVVMDRMSPDRTPARVRVSLHGQQGFIAPEPGLRVMLTGHLSPPQGPVEPGGFDFRRMAWFKGLGAVGYTRTPVLAVAPPHEGAAGLRIHRLRMRISAWVQAALPGETGAFAAAIMTGDRSAMGRDTLEALRASNLAHLLAISGLHMGLLTGFVFAALRLLLVAIPRLGLRMPVKKIAAFLSLLAGAGYYAMSGGNVATERAFIMVAVIFTAVIFDRRAITMRAVAIAAVIVLTLRPETLMQPGFQMSFAATTALVAVFGALRGWRGWSMPRPLRPVLAVVLSSAVAGLATAPVAAAHFNRIADYGLLANLLSVPLMGAVVMPAAVLTACLAPLGLGWLGLVVMRPAIGWILGVAHWVAGMEGSVTPVMAPSAVVLPLLALGMLWLILWRGRVRFAGLAPAALAFVLWSQTARPPLLITDTGALMGVMTETGRSLSKPRGDGFAALAWLENDGDAARQDIAHARPAFAEVGQGALQLTLAGQTVIQLRGKRGLAQLEDACERAALVIVNSDAEASGQCAVYDQRALRHSGSLAVYPEEGKLIVISAAEHGGTRLWSGHTAKPTLIARFAALLASR
ncbi:MAG: ComEC family competence protein [Rhodobacteraceae bacterium]|nr:ComEC family competence protein [Paracoccaceae bacterium]